MQGSRLFPAWRGCCIGRATRRQRHQSRQIPEDVWRPEYLRAVRRMSRERQGRVPRRPARNRRKATNATRSTPPRSGPPRGRGVHVPRLTPRSPRTTFVRLDHELAYGLRPDWRPPMGVNRRAHPRLSAGPRRRQSASRRPPRGRVRRMLQDGEALQEVRNRRGRHRIRRRARGFFAAANRPRAFTLPERAAFRVEEERRARVVAELQQAPADRVRFKVPAMPPGVSVSRDRDRGAVRRAEGRPGAALCVGPGARERLTADPAGSGLPRT